MNRLEELNQKCMRCLEEAEKRFEPIDRSRCASFCPVGREIHQIEVKSSSPWNKVDWNTAKYKEFYHRRNR